MTVTVNVDNFRAAETARMCDGFLALTGGVNTWFHFRAPTPVENQPVIRMNRDTLYSAAVVDVSEGATLTIPDAPRYISVMAVDAEHYIRRVFAEPGRHELTAAELGSEFVTLAARIFVDPADPADVAAVNDLQDRLGLEATAARPYQHPDYDPVSLDDTREGLLILSRGVPDTTRMFGAPAHVDPVRHLIGTATGWGGLPETEAYYVLESEPRAAGHDTMTFRDVPADAFWSLTVYNRDGYLEPNPFDAYSVNSVTATPEADGSVVVHLAPEPDGSANHVFVMDGWNYALRLYRPRPAVLDGTWVPPEPRPAG